MNRPEINENVGSEERSKAASRVTLAGLWVNLGLVAVKYVAGVLGASAAMIADATHSLSDTITDVAVIVGFHFVSKPADEDHRYGHGKIETLVAAFCGIMLAAAALGIMYPAAMTIWDVVMEGGEPPAPPGALALGAAVLSIVAKELLYRYTAAAGRRLSSPALIANAWHHRSDALSSLGTFVGIGGAIALGDKFAILDPIAAVAVGVMILNAAWGIIYQSCQELIEASIGEDGEQAIIEIISSTDGVLGHHAVRSRRIGYYIAIEAHVLVNENETVKQAHDTATRIERGIREKFGTKTHISIHIEPNTEDAYDCEGDRL